MGKFEWLGVLSFLGGIVLAMFQGISSMMTVGEITWEGKTLISVFGQDSFTWIDGIGVNFLKNLATTVANMQVFILLIGLGVFFFIVGMIFKD